MPKDKARSVMLTCRISPEENREVSSAVNRSGLDQSTWLRKIVLDASRKV